MSQSWLDVRQTKEFTRDIKRLTKRFPSLLDDIETFIDVELKLFHRLGQGNTGIVRISDTGQNAIGFYKARKFACKSLKGTGSRSGIRVIYSYQENPESATLIEAYFKGDKPNEDRARLKAFGGKP